MPLFSSHLRLDKSVDVAVDIFKEALAVYSIRILQTIPYSVKP